MKGGKRSERDSQWQGDSRRRELLGRRRRKKVLTHLDGL